VVVSEKVRKGNEEGALGERDVWAKNGAQKNDARKAWSRSGWERLPKKNKNQRTHEIDIKVAGAVETVS